MTTIFKKYLWGPKLHDEACKKVTSLTDELRSQESLVQELYDVLGTTRHQFLNSREDFFAEPKDVGRLHKQAQKLEEKFEQGKEKLSQIEQDIEFWTKRVEKTREWVITNLITQDPRPSGPAMPHEIIFLYQEKYYVITVEDLEQMIVPINHVFFEEDLKSKLYMTFPRVETAANITIPAIPHPFVSMKFRIHLSMGPTDYIIKSSHVFLHHGFTGINELLKLCNRKRVNVTQGERSSVKTLLLSKKMYFLLDEDQIAAFWHPVHRNFVCLSCFHPGGRFDTIAHLEEHQDALDRQRRQEQAQAQEQEQFDAFERQRQDEEKEREKLLANTTPCPNCKTPCGKDTELGQHSYGEGCNEIWCPTCGAHFCFRCGGLRYHKPEHGPQTIYEYNDTKVKKSRRWTRNAIMINRKGTTVIGKTLVCSMLCLSEHNMHKQIIDGQKKVCCNGLNVHE